MEKEARQEELEAEMADPELYNDADVMREKTAAYNAVRKELAELYKKWDALADALEAYEDA